MSTAISFASKTASGVLKVLFLFVILASANLAVASSRVFPNHPWPFQNHHSERHSRPNFGGSEFPHSPLNDSLFKAERTIWSLHVLSFYQQDGCGDVNPNPGKCQIWHKRLDLARARKSQACKKSFDQGSEVEKQFALDHGCKRDP
jgi:hypothetical protein